MRFLFQKPKISIQTRTGYSSYKIVLLSFFSLSMLSPDFYNVYGQSSTLTKDFSVGQEDRNLDKETLSRLFQSRLLVSGLVSGVSELNRTVDSIMESVFYSLMDQDVAFPITDDADFTSSYSRDVLPTSLGNYVVLDRFQIGPNLYKKLGRFGAIPIGAINSSKLFVINAQHRSDALRKAENAQLSFWPTLWKNWLGIIPLLSAILPPSFNPEELLDPIQYLQTPFLFPRNAAEALTLPLGTVRSYGLLSETSGNLDLEESGLKTFQSDLKLSYLDLKSLISLFFIREHKISILKHSEDHIWLSISETRRTGTNLNLRLNKNYRAFKNIFSFWKGFVVPIVPFDFDLERGTNIRTDEVFSFDLKSDAAKSVFEKVVNGNFELARKVAEEDHEATSGVHFLLKRVKIRDESGDLKSNSFYVQQSSTSEKIDKGETKTETPNGVDFTLQAEFSRQDKNWNLLVGNQTTNFTNQISIPVIKKDTPNKLSQYEFDTEKGKSPYMIASLKIVDNFVDSSEFLNYIRLVRRYSGLPLEDLPHIPLIPKDMRAESSLRAAFADPMTRIKNKVLTPPLLGKMEIFTNIHFSEKSIQKICLNTKNEIWSALASAFALNEVEWVPSALKKDYFFYANMMGSFILKPFKIFNIETNFPDFSHEGLRIEKALLSLKQATSPAELLEGYNQLFNTSHPIALTKVLIKLGQGAALPILVGFRNEALESKEDSIDLKEAKEAFGSLNGKVFQSRWPTPEHFQNSSSDQVLRQFEIGGFLNKVPPPELKKIRLILERRPTGEKTSNHFTIEIVTTPYSETKNQALKAYLRFESYQPLQVGRFILGEQLFSLQPIHGNEERKKEGGAEITHRAKIMDESITENRPLSDNSFQNDGSYEIYISLSNDGEHWGSEKRVDFRIETGILK